MRWPAAAALCAGLALTGCSSSSEEGTSAPQPTPESTPALLTLAESCPEIEAALPNRPGVLFPNIDVLSRFIDDLGAISAAGDQETVNAVVLMRPSLRQSLEALRLENQGDPDAFSVRLDAESSFLAALGSVADRCKAVGSSALQ